MQLFDDDVITVNSSTKISGALTSIFQPREGSLEEPTPTKILTQGTTKACLFTLIAYASDFEELVHTQKIIQIISKKFPCKIIFINIDQTTTNIFQRENIFFQNASQSSSNLVYELITIQTSKDQIPRIPFTVLPEITPDLPAYLLLGTTPLRTEQIFEPIMPYIQKILFEPSQVHNYKTFSEEILSSKYTDQYIDLNWIRLTPWREAIFRVFEDSTKCDHLRFAKSISIRYCKHPSSPHPSRPDTQALYLQAWLSQRFGWKLLSVEERDDRLHIFFQTGETSKIEIDTTAYESNLIEEGSVTSIEIHGAGDTHYLINYETDDRHIVVHSSSADRCEMPFVLFVGSFQKGHLLMNELFRKSLSASRQYILMLKEFEKDEWKHKRIHQS